MRLWATKLGSWVKVVLHSVQDAVSSAPIFIIRRVGGSSWHGKWVRSEYAAPALVEGQNGFDNLTGKILGEGAVKSWGSALLLAAALFVHQPFFSRLRLCLFTSRSSRGCGCFVRLSWILSSFNVAFFHLFGFFFCGFFLSKSFCYCLFFCHLFIFFVCQIFVIVMMVFVIKC